jgi:hypothetical protein
LNRKVMPLMNSSHLNDPPTSVGGIQNSQLVFE